MLLSIPICLVYDGDYVTFLKSGILVSMIGMTIWLITKGAKSTEFRKRDGYLVVALGWLAMTSTGVLPYLINGGIPNLSDAFFETMSGFSTTGATILTDIESLDPGLLFWRSLTQWMGGMGIIVLTIAVLPFLGIGGTQLFIAEAPGISPDKLKPRIKETAKRLWLIYLGLTVIVIFLLYGGGMPFFDAISHAFTTVATAGFSTKNASIAYFDSAYIQYVIILFMIICGTNFSLIYFALRINLKKMLFNEEFRFYIIFLIVVSIIVGYVVSTTENEPLEKSIRMSVFQVVSIVTTTGYTTADYWSWHGFIPLLFFVLMFFGASLGSTGGGVKLVRHWVLIKNSIAELKRLLHPTAIIPLRFNGKAVSNDLTYNIIAFIVLYVMIFVVGSIIMGILGADFITAIGSVAACLGNVGPGIGSVGPSGNYAHLSDISKWFLSFLMIVGRLELFTILVLFTPYFWRRF